MYFIFFINLLLTSSVYSDSTCIRFSNSIADSDIVKRTTYKTSGWEFYTHPDTLAKLDWLESLCNAIDTTQNYFGTSTFRDDPSYRYFPGSSKEDQYFAVILEDQEKRLKIFVGLIVVKRTDSIFVKIPIFQLVALFNRSKIINRNEDEDLSVMIDYVLYGFNNGYKLFYRKLLTL